jgi:hypothetical protein
MGTAGVNAQVRIGGNTAPNAAAVLDLNASDSENGTKALVLPRVSLSALTGDAAKLAGQALLDGMLVYNTNTGLGAGLYCWVTNKWIKLTVEDENVRPTIVDLNVKTITGDYTVLPTDDILLYTTAEGNNRLTLPTEGVTIGRKLYISDSTAGRGLIVFSPSDVMHNQTYTLIYAGSCGTIMYVGNGKWTMISGG